MTFAEGQRPPLEGVRVVEMSVDVACAAAGRLLSDLGATVVKLVGPALDRYRGEELGLSAADARAQSLLYRYLNDGKSETRQSLAIWTSGAEAAQIVISDVPEAIDDLADHFSGPARPHAAPVCVSITPWGETGPLASVAGNDFVAYHASGFAFDLRATEADAPLVTPSRSAAFLVGTTAAAAALHALLMPKRDTVRRIDVSMQEAIAAAHQPRYNSGPAPAATSAATSGNPVVFSLRCADGFVAVSPREPHQWEAWVTLMGSPPWSADSRFATLSERRTVWPELYELMSAWSRTVTTAHVYSLARQLRVPCLVHSAPSDLVSSPQLVARGYFRHASQDAVLPGVPFRLTSAPAEHAHPQPREDTGTAVLAGTRVLDFSWVLAGPICTRYLAMLGADVIKVESRSRPALSVRNAEWVRTNTGKRSVTLNLQSAAARALVRELALRSDVLVENFSTGVMERLGLDHSSLHESSPGLVFASSSSFGRTGPDRDLGAYGTLIQCFTGWASQCSPPDSDVLATGGIWTDPYVGVLQTACVLAALYRVRSGSGTGVYVDLSMAEATIGTLPDPLFQWQSTHEPPRPLGNRDRVRAPQGVYPAAGTDSWVAISVDDDQQWRRLVKTMDRPQLLAHSSFVERSLAHDEIDRVMGEWTRGLDADEVVARLRAAAVPAATCSSAVTVRVDEQLLARGFFGPVDGEVEHGSRLPWIVDGATFADRLLYPELGEANHDVVCGVLGRSQAEFNDLLDDGTIF